MSMIGNYRRIRRETLDACRAAPARVAELLYDESNPPIDSAIDIDKAWHGLHFLLNQTEWTGSGSLFDAVLGGTPIGDDVGYGPARFLTPEAVKATAAALAEFPVDAKLAALDLRAMDKLEIYPQIWDEGDEAKEYIRFGFDAVREIFQQAAERDEAMLVWVN
jgi:hypothetical protein